jgi:hypothetical protein
VNRGFSGISAILQEPHSIMQGKPTSSLARGLSSFSSEAVPQIPMKSSVRWLLFEYQGLELVILSKPFKTKKLSEKARRKYPERRAKKIGIGVVRVPATR